VIWSMRLPMYPTVRVHLRYVAELVLQGTSTFVKRRCYLGKARL
jgi:hypothetical protein